MEVGKLKGKKDGKTSNHTFSKESDHALAEACNS